MKLLSSYFDQSFTTEEMSQIGKITLVCNMVAVVLLAFFAGLALLTGDARYSLSLFGVMGGGLLNILVFLKTKNVRVFIGATSLGYLAFCVFLQITGGQNKTGILWHYVYPVTIFYISGLRWGTVSTLSLIIIEVVLLACDDCGFIQTHYPMDFKIRFIATMLVVSSFGALLEHSREKAQGKLACMAKRFHLASQTDELTGLANRRAIREKLENETRKASRIRNDFVVVLCDVDDFKKVNDRFGHTVGDQVLRHLSSHFQVLLRKNDMVSRWGGEEFLFLLPDTDFLEGLAVAERIRAEVEKSPYRLDEQTEIKLTISCGVSHWKKHENLDSLINAADAKLYRAKQGGRNQIVWNLATS